jgi:hypothetical protein
MDLVAILLTIGFFVVCAALTVWCDRVLRGNGEPPR